MQTQPFIKNSITINAPIEKVWDALVNPAQTKKYMFGCETVSDWKVGSSLLWRGEYEGEEMVFVEGEILSIEPGKHLAYTTIDPNSDIDDVTENYLTVTYDLEQVFREDTNHGKQEVIDSRVTNSREQVQTILKVTQGDYTLVAEGARRYEEGYNNGEGWNPILIQIKKMVEEN